MFHDLTHNARSVISAAREEAARFAHGSISSAHILLGLIMQPTCLGVQILSEYGINMKQIKGETEKGLSPGSVSVPTTQIGFASDAKMVLQLANTEAKALGHFHVGTEHLLLGLIAEPGGIAGKVLRALGCSLEATRKELARRVDPDMGRRRIPVDPNADLPSSLDEAHSLFSGTDNFELVDKRGTVRIKYELRGPKVTLFDEAGTLVGFVDLKMEGTLRVKDRYGNVTASVPPAQPK